MSPLKRDISQPSKMFIARDLCINRDGIRFKDIRLIINANFGNLIPAFDFRISRLPVIIQKRFCTPDGAMDPTFQMKYAF